MRRLRPAGVMKPKSFWDTLCVLRSAIVKRAGLALVTNVTDVADSILRSCKKQRPLLQKYEQFGMKCGNSGLNFQAARLCIQPRLRPGHLNCELRCEQRAEGTPLSR